MAGYDTVELAKQFEPPLCADEGKIRENMRNMLQACPSSSGSFGTLFASKALSFTGIYRIAAQRMSTDVVSGELYTALRAGFRRSAYFHGNNKTDEDIRYAIDSGIGYFIVDNAEELRVINEYAGEKGIGRRYSFA